MQHGSPEPQTTPGKSQCTSSRADGGAGRAQGHIDLQFQSQDLPPRALAELGRASTSLRHTSVKPAAAARVEKALGVLVDTELNTSCKEDSWCPGLP